MGEEDYADPGLDTMEELAADEAMLNARVADALDEIKRNREEQLIAADFWDAVRQAERLFFCLEW